MYVSAAPATGAAGLTMALGSPLYTVLGTFALIAAWSALLRLLPRRQA